MATLGIFDPAIFDPAIFDTRVRTTTTNTGSGNPRRSSSSAGLARMLPTVHVSVAFVLPVPTATVTAHVIADDWLLLGGLLP